MPNDAINSAVDLMVFHTARIAEGIHIFEFRRADGAALPAFTAGAHVTVRTPNGLLRKYSICNDPSERDRYVIAVKREAGGRGGSISLIDNTKTGDQLLVSAPVNNFQLPRRPDHFLFIAGGIGITPIMAMIRQLTSVGGKHFKLYYCVRSPAHAAFFEELNAPGYKDKVLIHYDDGDPTQSLDLRSILQERKNREHLFCCGPRPLMQSVHDLTAHWGAFSVHFEAFSDAETHKLGDKPFTVKLARSGEVVEVLADKTILEALRERGHNLPSSCETGTCGTCRSKLISGEVDHRDLFLTEQQRADSIMICVSRARSNELVIDRAGLK